MLEVFIGTLLGILLLGLFVFTVSVSITVALTVGEIITNKIEDRFDR